MATTDPAVPQCQNCSAQLPQTPHAHYCPQCGQETHLHPPSLLEFLHEFLGHYVALEGALWRTLRALLLQPGKLTQEYLAGRRRRYVLPLRLYLSASFCFFLLVKVGGLGLSMQVSEGLAPASMEAVMVDTERDGSSPENLKVWSERCAAEPSPCALLESRVARTVQRLARSEDPIGDFLRRMVSLAPYAVFALLPLFAGVLQWTHRSARLRYGAHYVLGLHLHALWFFMLLALALLPEGWTGPVLIGLWIHGIIALHRVYGLGWGSSVVRGALATLLYGLLLTLATSALTLALLLG